MSRFPHLLRWLIRRSRAARLRRGNGGFTIAEIMMASGISTLIMGGVIYLYTFSSRAAGGVGRQLEYVSQARILGFIANEVKSAQTAKVQTYDGTSFSDIASGSLQQGNALSLSVPLGTNTYQVLYWVNSTGTLYRATLNSGNRKPWLTNVTNTLPFSVTSFNGTVGKYQSDNRADTAAYV